MRKYMYYFRIFDFENQNLEWIKWILNAGFRIFHKLLNGYRFSWFDFETWFDGFGRSIIKILEARIFLSLEENRRPDKILKRSRVIKREQIRIKHGWIDIHIQSVP